MLRRIYMKILVFVLWVFTPSVFASSFYDDRAFGMFDQAVQQEARFQALLQNSTPETAMREEIEALMQARYREHAFATAFQEEVHSYVPRAQADKNYSINPTDLESYKRLRLMDAIAEDLSSRVAYEYKRLAESVADPRVALDLRQKANLALETITQNLASLAPEDRVVLTSFLEEINETKAAPPLQTAVTLLKNKVVRTKVNADIAQKAANAVLRANKILSKKMARAF